MVVDETIVKQYPGLAAREQRYKERGYEHNLQKITIGIHTGSDYTNQVNFGTLITPEIGQWLNESMDKMKWEPVPDDDEVSPLILEAIRMLYPPFPQLTFLFQKLLLYFGWDPTAPLNEPRHPSVHQTLQAPFI